MYHAPRSESPKHIPDFLIRLRFSYLLILIFLLMSRELARCLLLLSFVRGVSFVLFTARALPQGAERGPARCALSDVSPLSHFFLSWTQSLTARLCRSRSARLPAADHAGSRRWSACSPARAAPAPRSGRPAARRTYRHARRVASRRPGLEVSRSRGLEAEAVPTRPCAPERLRGLDGTALAGAATGSSKTGSSKTGSSKTGSSRAAQRQR